MLVPVIQNLLSNGYSVTVLGLTTGLSYFQQNGIEAISISQVAAQLKDWSRIRRIGESIAPNVAKSKVVLDTDTVAYYGIGYLNLLLENSTEAAEEKFKRLERKSFFPVNTALDVLRKLKPDILLTTNSPRFERAFVTAAQVCSIKSLVLVDAIAVNELPWLKDQGYGNKICVFHESVKTRLIEHGRPSHEICVTGNPAFLSPLLQKKVPRRRTTKVKLLYLSQSELQINSQPQGNWSNDSVVQSTLDELSELACSRGAQIRVRFHPNQNVGGLIIPHLVEVSNSMTELETDLYESDVVLTASSSAGLQAISYGIPILQIGWSNRSKQFRYSDFGPSIFVEQPKNIGSDLRLLMTAASDKTAFSFPDPKLSAIKICKLIKNLSDLG